MKDTSSLVPLPVKMGLISTVIASIVTYRMLLLSRASDKWQSLPEVVVKSLSPFYKKINLSKVRYATNINTVHGQATTIENDIFFPERERKIDILNNANDLHWMLHELEHVVQYEDLGGVTLFMTKYLLEASVSFIKSVLTKGCVDIHHIHDSMGLEQEAINKSNLIIEDAINILQQNSPTPLSLSMSQLDEKLIREIETSKGEKRVTIQATAGDFVGWYLDFDNDKQLTKDGVYDVSENLELAKQRGSGAFWKIQKEEKTTTIQATAGRFKGWFLDFNNNKSVTKDGVYDVSENLELSKQKGSGATWTITREERGCTIQATAGKYRGWFLDFNNSKPVKKQGDYDVSENLELSLQRGSGAYWKIG